MIISKTYAKIVAFAVCVAMLSACGGATEEQDAQLPTNQAPDSLVPINGVALNGYLANAIVWIDSRENNSPDGFETFAYTDSQGYFSYNPNSGTNYCESSQTSLQRFCLKTGAPTGNLVIKVAKGVELMTGEAFRSVLTANVSVDKARENMQNALGLGPKPSGDTSVWQAQLDDAQVTLSSISSIAHYLNKSGQGDLSLRNALNDYGFSLSANMSNQDIVNIDYIAGAALGDADATSLFMADATLGRIVDVISINLNEAAQGVDFGQDGLPLSTADSVYESMARNFYALTSLLTSQRSTQVATQSALLVAKAGGSDSYSAILQDAIEQLLGSFSAANLNLPAVQTRIGALSGNQNIANMVNNLYRSAQLISADFSAQNDNTLALAAFQQTILLPTLTHPVAYAGEAELVAIMALSEILASSDYIHVFEVLTDMAFGVDGTQDIIEAVKLDLQSLSNDLREIVENSAEVADAIALDTGNENGLDQSALEAGVTAIENGQDSIEVSTLADVQSVDGTSPWANKKLSLSGIQDNAEQGQVIAYFTQDGNSNTGELIMCVAYKNYSDPSDDIDGKRFVGTWSALGGESQSRMSLVAEGFNIQMNVLGETLGRDIPSDQQIPSLGRNPNEAYGKFGFTLNEDKATWHSDDASVNGDFGLKDAQDVPENNQACAAVLGLSD